MNTINIIELCAGYGSQALALKRLGIPYDVVAWAEFDPESKRPLDEQPAVIAHDLLHPEAKGRNLGDMTKIDWVKWRDEHPGVQIDLLTYSTPCQSISQAGLQHGLAEDSGTRSSILWYTENAIRALQPKYLLQENVKALVSKKFFPDFQKWCNRVEDLGYTNHWKIMDSSQYGVPQHRERVFMVSVRNDLGRDKFVFPSPYKLEKCLADVLEEDTDERYFLKEEMVQKFLKTNEQDGDEMIYMSTDKFLTQEEIDKIIAQNASDTN